MLPIMKRIKQALKEVDVLVTIGCTNDNDVLKLILKNDPMATIHFGIFISFLSHFIFKYTSQ